MGKLIPVLLHYSVEFNVIYSWKNWDKVVRRYPSRSVFPRNAFRHPMKEDDEMPVGGVENKRSGYWWKGLMVEWLLRYFKFCFLQLTLKPLILVRQTYEACARLLYSLKIGGTAGFTIVFLTWNHVFTRCTMCRLPKLSWYPIRQLNYWN